MSVNSNVCPKVDSATTQIELCVGDRQRVKPVLCIVLLVWRSVNKLVVFGSIECN
ncbi:hypothetical protein [Chamaesiphon sp. GL140_3_metabinner_50]|uniref:hypothetical protein n=1 Tax=Chamaesiphon sp. GL140_3_metabinner_50 TaxID=2970812 RepID=UPI0025F11F08|nr:hypothetical protein [Chamaesiphon sp. GL140_3_metabinner_50]